MWQHNQQRQQQPQQQQQQQQQWQQLWQQHGLLTRLHRRLGQVLPRALCDAADAHQERSQSV